MRLIIALFAVVTAFFMGFSEANAQVTASSIRGIVKDTKGGELPGATVVATHTPSGSKYGTVTNEKGRFVLPSVRVGGPYTVTVTFVGFKEQSKADRDLYSQAELKAREAKIGLWQDNKAIEPSAFRHK